MKIKLKTLKNKRESAKDSSRVYGDFCDIFFFLFIFNYISVCFPVNNHMKLIRNFFKML